MTNKLLWAFLILERGLLRIRLGFLAAMIVVFVRFLFGAQIPAEVKIGRGTIFGYGGLATVVHKDAIIGENCRIGTSVVLGSRYPTVGAPVIEADCYIGSGAKILGPVTIGRGSVVGANSVVTRDVPERSVAAGMPAKIIKEDIEIERYNENFFN